MWGFFNHRKLIRRWRTVTQSMNSDGHLTRKSDQQIRGLFNTFSGKRSFGKELSQKQFKNALESIFNQPFTHEQAEVLMNMVDVDHDGGISIEEFTGFMDQV